MSKNISHEQELLRIIAELQTKNSELQKRLIELENKLAKLSKNSSNSSKPPSSDIVTNSGHGAFVPKHIQCLRSSIPEVQKSCLTYLVKTFPVSLGATTFHLIENT